MLFKNDLVTLFLVHIKCLKIYGEAWNIWFANVPHFEEMAEYVNQAKSK